MVYTWSSIADHASRPLVTLRRAGRRAPSVTRRHHACSLPGWRGWRRATTETGDAAKLWQWAGRPPGAARTHAGGGAPRDGATGTFSAPVPAALAEVGLHGAVPEQGESGGAERERGLQWHGDVHRRCGTPRAAGPARRRRPGLSRWPRPRKSLADALANR